MLTDCVPSKTLIATAEVMTEVEEAGELGVRVEATGDDDPANSVRVDLSVVNKRVKALATAQSDGHQPPAGPRQGPDDPAAAAAWTARRRSWSATSGWTPMWC